MAEETKKEAVAEKTSEKSAKKAPKKKKSFFKRVGNFFKEYKSELKKVVWYPRKQVVRDTGIVVAALAVCGAVIGVLDLAFTQIILLLGHIG